MDFKYKIIIMIFVAVAVVYLAQFLLQSTATNKTKKDILAEDDDVEHYSEPIYVSNGTSQKQTSGETKYDQRILLLDDIEKLQISNKEVKGLLMEYLFTDDVLKKSAQLSDKEREEMVKAKYEELSKERAKVPERVPEKAPESAAGGESKKNSASLAQQAEHAEHKVKDMFEEVNRMIGGVGVAGGVPDATISHDMTEIISNMDDTLSQMKKIKEGLLKINEASKVAMGKPSQPPSSSKNEKAGFTNFEMPSFPMVEGFENSPYYAPFK